MRVARKKNSQAGLYREPQFPNKNNLKGGKLK
jgi:hypothetical protein